jgi:signal peptidase
MNQQELSHTLRKEIIGQGRSVQIIASGYSMFPFLRKGDLLTVEPVSMDKIKRGDVVVFESEEKWIAHRVIRIMSHINEIQFLLRGDTNLHFDEEVNHKNYIGRIKYFERKNKSKNIDNYSRVLWTILIRAAGVVYSGIFRFTLRVFNKIEVLF